VEGNLRECCDILVRQNGGSVGLETHDFFVGRLSLELSKIFAFWVVPVLNHRIAGGIHSIHYTLNARSEVEYLIVISQAE
jgi:hypothetical protein